MFRIALAASLVALASVPSLAQDHGQPTVHGQNGTYTSAPTTDTITVSAPTLAIWSAKLSRSLGATMRYPMFFSNELPSEGTARVRFACSDSGSPAALELVRSSGDKRIDRAALSAVRRLKTLHPLPFGMSHDQRYVAALVFATSDESLKRQEKVIRDQLAARANAGSSKDIALLVATRRTTS